MTIKNYLVRAVLAEDINAPYAWLSSLPCASRSIVKLVNKETSQSVWCEVIKAGESFIKRYNGSENTLKISQQEPFIILNEWYRDNLGLRKNATNQIEICCHKWLPFFIKQLLASYRHPDNNVRLAVDLSFVSLLLGVIGLVLSVIQ